MLDKPPSEDTSAENAVVRVTEHAEAEVREEYNAAFDAAAKRAGSTEEVSQSEVMRRFNVARGQGILVREEIPDNNLNELAKRLGPDGVLVLKDGGDPVCFRLEDGRKVIMHGNVLDTEFLIDGGKGNVVVSRFGKEVIISLPGKTAERWFAVDKYLVQNPKAIEEFRVAARQMEQGGLTFPPMFQYLKDKGLLNDEEKSA